MAGEPPRGARKSGMAAGSQVRWLKMGVTAFALAGGLSAYMLLLQLGVPALPATLLGLAFAILARVALTSLVGDWLRAVARRQRPSAQSDSPRQRGTPAPRQ